MDKIFFQEIIMDTSFFLEVLVNYLQIPVIKIIFDQIVPLTWSYNKCYVSGVRFDTPNNLALNLFFPQN